MNTNNNSAHSFTEGADVPEQSAQPVDNINADILNRVNWLQNRLSNFNASDYEYLVFQFKDFAESLSVSPSPERGESDGYTKQDMINAFIAGENNGKQRDYNCTVDKGGQLRDANNYIDGIK